MSSVFAVGLGVATAAFLVSTLPITLSQRQLTRFSQGRAGLVAYRRSRGGLNAAGKAFYKGGFEPKMNKREAALILSLSYVSTSIPRAIADLLTYTLPVNAP